MFEMYVHLLICAKQWDLGYDELLTNFNVPKLQSRRVQHRLCTMFKILHDLISFPSSIFVPRPSRYRPNMYFQPFVHDNCLFVPNTISFWNSLPTNVTNVLTLSAFKSHIHTLI